MLPRFIGHLHLKLDVLTKLVLRPRNLKGDIMGLLKKLLVAVVEGLALSLRPLRILVLHVHVQNEGMVVTCTCMNKLTVCSDSGLAICYYKKYIRDYT